MVCGSTDDDPATTLTRIDGVDVVRYRFPKASALDPRRFSHHIAEVKRAIEPLMSSGKWDVIHAHAPAPALAAFSKAPAGSRRIYTVHSPAVLEQRVNWSNAGPVGLLKRMFGLPALRRYESEALRQASAVHVLSAYTERTIEGLYGRAVVGKLVRIPWWPSPTRSPVGKTAARIRLGWRTDGNLLLTVRRMVPRMGLDTLLDAAEGLSEIDFRIVLAGEGPLSAALQKRAHRGTLANRVLFPGRLSEEQLGWAYEACDAFVLPTRTLECFGIIAVEAMGYDRPVIGSDTGAIPEIIAPVLPGWLFRAGNPGSLRAVLARFLRGELIPPTPGTLARYADDRFGRDRLAHEYRRLFSGQGIA